MLCQIELLPSGVKQEGFQVTAQPRNFIRPPLTVLTWESHAMACDSHVKTRDLAGEGEFAVADAVGEEDGAHGSGGGRGGDATGVGRGAAAQE